MPNVTDASSSAAAFILAESVVGNELEFANDPNLDHVGFLSSVDDEDDTDVDLAGAMINAAGEERRKLEGHRSSSDFMRWQDAKRNDHGYTASPYPPTTTNTPKNNKTTSKCRCSSLPTDVYNNGGRQQQPQRRSRSREPRKIVQTRTAETNNNNNNNTATATAAARGRPSTPEPSFLLNHNNNGSSLSQQSLRSRSRDSTREPPPERQQP
jgi:hypothetical protein